MLFNCGSIKWAPGTISIPYEYNNNNDDYLGIVGDFDEILYRNSYNIRFMVRYYNGFEDRKGGLELLIGTRNGSVLILNGQSVNVESSNFGVIEVDNIKNRYEHQYIYFYKEIEANTRDEVIRKLRNDKIIIKINDQRFMYLAPEFKE